MYIFIHGWASDLSRSKSFVESLNNAGIETVLLTLPGFDTVPEPTDNWGVKEYADWVTNELQQYDETNLNLIGYSFGGSLAMICATNSDLVISSLTIISASGIRESNMIVDFKVRIAKTLKPVLSSIPISEKILSKFRRFLGATDYDNASPRMKEILKNIINDDIRTYLKPSDIRTTFIYGSEDKATPPSFIDYFGHFFENHSRHIIENADHYAIHNRQEEIITIIRDQ